jgi:hypothetical protein
MATATPEVPKVVEIDCSTGVETVRDMTAEELEAQEAMRAEFEARQAAELEAKEAEEALKASAREKFAALGLTEDEVNAIVK